MIGTFFLRSGRKMNSLKKNDQFPMGTWQGREKIITKNEYMCKMKDVERN